MSQDPICPVHHKPMRFSKKHGWSCPTPGRDASGNIQRDAQGNPTGWCTYKPPEIAVQPVIPVPGLGAQPSGPVAPVAVSDSVARLQAATAALEFATATAPNIPGWTPAMVLMIAKQAYFEFLIPAYHGQLSQPMGTSAGTFTSAA